MTERQIVALGAEKMRETQFKSLDNWYEDNVVCPVDHTKLKFDGRYLISERGRRYPVVKGVPILLANNEKQTIELATATINRAHGKSDVIDLRAPDLYLETLGISEEEKNELIKLIQERREIDPVVSMIVAATCGNAYRHLIADRRLTE